MKRKTIVKEVTLSRMVEEMNYIFKEKKTGKLFNIIDLEGYIRRKKLPNYLGKYEIVKSPKDCGVSLYNLNELIEEE